ncbi:MAG TPA: alternate-type signal peptide domain-containing protein [Microbacteriaceae bacterium]
MNKLTKGAIAGAAGIALLLGGAGSFALWNGSASASAGQIQSGALSVAKTGNTDGTWQNTPNGSSTPASVTISSFKAVPGDTLTFTQKLDVTAIGDNLTATLAVDPTSIVANATNPTASAALRTALLQGMTVSIASLPANIVAGGTANTFTVTNATAPQTVTVVVTLPFPRGTAGDNTTQAGSVNLSSLAFTLTQN